MADSIDTAPCEGTATTRPALRWERGTRRRIPRPAGAEARELVVLSRRPHPRPLAESRPQRRAWPAGLHALRVRLDADVAALAVAALMLGTLLYA